MASAHVQQPSSTPEPFKISPHATNASQGDASPQPVSPSSPTSSQPRPRSMLDIGLEAAAKTPKKRTDSALGASPESSVTMSPTNSSKPAPILSTTSPTPPPSSDGSPSGSKSPLRIRPVSTPTMASMTSTIPRSIPEEMPREKPIPLERKTSDRINGGTPPSPSTAGSSDRPKLLSRVGSMLKRTKSGNNNSLIPVESNDSSRASTTSIPEKSAPQKTFTFSSRSSGTSPSGTPPSPGSPSSTIFEHESERMEDTSSNLRRNSHSQSSHALAPRATIRPGITWGPHVDGGLRPPLSPNRRRSASTEHVPTIRKPGPKSVHEDEDGEIVTVPLIAAFSKDAPEGAGLKSRRLSTALPDQFIVDHCELDKEFVSSSKIPFRRGKAVGEGATATVRLMYRKGDADHTIYAVKEFRGRDKREDSEEDYCKKIMGEYTIAKSLHHPNIVDTVRLCTHHGRWDHVMEYCAHGELFQYVSKRLFQTCWTLKDQQCFFKQLVRAVDYLHGHGIAHRDIKLENLLLTSEGCLKLTDFGVADVFCGEHPGVRASGGECGKNMGEVRRCRPGILGSLPYMAPEVLAKKGDYDPRGLDVWSCAIVYLTMTYGGNPWPAANEQNTYYLRFKNGYEKWMRENADCVITDNNYPVCGPLFKFSERLGGPSMKRLMLKMMNPNPDKRISIHDVLLSNAVKGIECCTEESYEEGSTYNVDASKGKAVTSDGKKAKMQVKKKHSHVPPKEHKTPKVFQHRFDMGDGYS